MVLVRRLHETERVARRPLVQVDGGRVGERAREQRLDRADAGGAERERLRLRGARTADRAAGARRVADERGIGGAALGAARQVRQVARDPQELQLEGERERVERRPLRDVRRIVEEVEEPRPVR